MRVRLKLKTKLKNSCSCAICQSDSDKEFGLVILEANPQIRSILIESSLRRTFRFPFPYLIMAVSYEVRNGKFIYHGVSKRGLNVFF